MKKRYVRPNAKMVDFSYEDQVVASSVCNNYSAWGKENPKTCQDELKDVPQLAKITFVGCIIYLDQAGL